MVNSTKLRCDRNESKSSTDYDCYYYEPGVFEGITNKNSVEMKKMAYQN